MKVHLYLFFFGIILFMFSASNVMSVDHYYYWNERIELTPRTDRVLVVFKDTDMSVTAQQNELNFIISGYQGETSNVLDNTWMIKFSDKLFLPTIESFIQTISGRSNNIKYVSKVYQGESESVVMFPTDEIIVRLRNLSDKSSLDFLNQQNNSFIVGNVSNERSFLIKTNSDNSLSGLELAEIYRSSAIFEFAEPNFGYAEWSLLHLIPNDPLFPSQWALRNTSQSVTTGGFEAFGDALTTMGITGADMDVTRAWDFTTGSSLITVGVFDTGIDSSHADLSANMVRGYDATTNTYGAAVDPNGHGTQCAGLIAAVMNNSIGVAGIAPSSKLMNIRIFNASGSTTEAWIIRALDTAFLNNIDVMSHSWGGGPPSAGIESSFNNNILNGRGGLGTIALASTGNDGRNPPSYPAAYDNVVSIGASTQEDIKKSPGTGNQYWWGGNYGERSVTSFLAFVAPTVCYTTATGGGYSATFNGTSASCPNAAGVAALVLSVNLGLTATQVYEFMARGCDKVDNVSYNKVKPYGKWNDYYGYGRVNAYNSVRLAAGVDVTPPTVVHQNVSSHSSTYPTLISAEIIDQNNASVPTSGVNQPKLFYRHRTTGGVWSGFDSTEAQSNMGNNFEFQIPGFGYGTEVNYYIRGRDAAGNETTFPKHALSMNSYTLCFFGIGEMVEYTDKLTSWTFDAANSNSPIINVPGSFNHSLTDVSVRIYLRHNWINDLSVITIWSPSANTSNNRKAIWGRNYATNTPTPGGGIQGSLVEDDATDFWKDGFMASGLWSGGNYKPDHPFVGLLGQNMDGNWRFTGRDVVAGDPANFDSIRVHLTGLDDVLSPCAKLDTEADSILLFPSNVEVDTMDFYIKNTGSANLTISGHNITGNFPSRFSVINSPPASVSPGDSGLFRVRYDPFALRMSKEDMIYPDADENAILTILNDDPSKSNFEVSLQNENIVADVGISSVASPSTGQIVNANGSDVMAYVMNYGAAIVSNVNVFYNLNGGTPVGPVVVAGPLNPGDSAMVTFTGANQLTSMTDMTGTVKVYTDYSLDSNLTNDTGTVSNVFLRIPPASFPYFSDFSESPSPYTLSGSSALWGLFLTTNPSGTPSDAAARANFWGVTSGFQILRSTLVDLTGTTNPLLSFYRAYRTYSGENDQLQVLVSTNGGMTWSAPLYQRGWTSVPSLGTLPASTLSPFTPSDANHWMHNLVDLSAYAGQEVVVGFNAISAWGNNLWIDNIKISDADNISLIPVNTPGTYGNLMTNGVQINFTALRPGLGSGIVTQTDNQGLWTPENVVFGHLSAATEEKEQTTKDASMISRNTSPVSPDASEGVLALSRVDDFPVNNSYASNAAATTFSGAIFTPDVVANRYWEVAFTGDDHVSTATYDVILDISTQPGIVDPDRLYIMRRVDQNSDWVCISTITEYELGLPVRLIATGLTGFSQFSIGAEDGTLPVDLVEFNATVDRNNVTLNWTTAWEENNMRFDVQRRIAETDAAWATVGSVTGSGTTQEQKFYSFLDKNLVTGKYEYRLVQFDFDGNSTADHTLSSQVEVGIPTEFALSQNYPNPFNPTTKIDFQIPVEGLVKLSVYDMSGREVATLVNEALTPGYYTYTFNGANFASGVYFYRLATSNNVMTKRAVLVK